MSSFSCLIENKGVTWLVYLIKEVFMNVEEHFLAAQTLVTEEVTYSQDEDGNIMIIYKMVCI